MARQLYVKQKKYIDKIIKERSITCWEDLTLKEINHLESIYDWEDIYSHVNMYICDKMFDNRFII